jgi:hypothetical protein
MQFTQFDQYANKLQFQPFTVDSAPCCKCTCTTVLIVPTNNVHAASARCQNCGKFFRWLGKWELEKLVARHPASKLPVQQSVAKDTGQQSAQHINSLSLDNQQPEAAGG